MFFRIRLSHVEEAAETPAGTCFGYRHARIGKYSPMPPGSRSKFICNAQLSSGNSFGILGTSGQFQFLSPAMGGVSESSLPSVRAGYDEAGAPSSTQKPDYA
jgi:hypothetical protein